MQNTAELARLLGIGAGVLAGLAFAVLTVGIRKTVTSETSAEAVVFLINAMGVVTLGPWCVWHVGLTPLVQTPLPDLGVMLAAGAMNLIGFLLVTKSLQLIAVVRVNVINNGLTMALTVVAGMVLFAESWNRNILLGILLSAVGTLLISLADAGRKRCRRYKAPEFSSQRTRMTIQHIDLVHFCHTRLRIHRSPGDLSGTAAALHRYRRRRRACNHCGTGRKQVLLDGRDCDCHSRLVARRDAGSPQGVLAGRRLGAARCPRRCR